MDHISEKMWTQVFLCSFVFFVVFSFLVSRQTRVFKTASESDILDNKKKKKKKKKGKPVTARETTRASLIFTTVEKTGGIIQPLFGPIPPPHTPHPTPPHTQRVSSACVGPSCGLKAVKLDQTHSQRRHVCTRSCHRLQRARPSFCVTRGSRR